MAGSVLIGVLMPSRLAVAAMLGRPISSATRAATVLIDWARATCRVTGPEKPSPSIFCGDQLAMVIGSSTRMVSGVRPVSSAVR